MLLADMARRREEVKATFPPQFTSSDRLDLLLLGTSHSLVTAVKLVHVSCFQ